MTQLLELPSVVDLTPDRPTAISERRAMASTLLRGGAVFRKLTRLILVASVAAGLGVAPMLGANAAGRVGTVDAYSDHFEVPLSPDPQRLEIHIGDTAAWNIIEGEHTVTPKNPKFWGDDGDKQNTGLTPEGVRYEAAFKSVGMYIYYCEVHGGLNEDGSVDEGRMWGYVRVIDPSTTTTQPTAPPQQTTTTTIGSTAPTGPATTPTTARPPAVGGAAVHTPSTAAPRPTTTTAKADKHKKPNKADETTTTTAVPAPPPPVDIPDSAIIPALPGSDQLPATTEIQEGAIGEAPNSTPEGDAIALLKPNKRGGNGVKLLIASGLGLGALALGTAGYKFANRSSKYFPA
jgi:plastocyanin